VSPCSRPGWFFQHDGSVAGDVSLPLTFDAAAVSDALKSLVIADSGSSAPSVSYPSGDTLEKTLKSLRIDISGHPGMAEILDSMRGTAVRIAVPAEIRGRILGVELRGIPGNDSASGKTEAFLSLLCTDGIKVFALSEIASFSFEDPAVSADLARALDLVLSSRASDVRTLLVRLPGKGVREVSLGYVIPAPVWKVSYRLDLASEQPILQGWAIVDNCSDMDWKNVELSLVTGKPVSFIQNLYDPYYLERPEIPLSIAGTAAPQVYDSAYDSLQFAGEEAGAGMASAPMMMEKSAIPPSPAPAAKRFSLADTAIETPAGSAAGDLFEFTVKKPVDLERQQSAMFPLVNAPIGAEKVSVVSGNEMEAGSSVHPMLCVVLKNATGMKLPAGPVTVYDGNGKSGMTYAGDALLEFFPEGERRMIAYGEDLSVSCALTRKTSREAVSVRVDRGVMTVVRKYTYGRVYQLKNSGTAPRRIVIEHPVQEGAELVRPAKFDERTASLYRFSLNLAGGGETAFSVDEQTPVSETVALSDFSDETFLYYSSSKEIPEKVRSALERAAGLKRATEACERARADIEEARDGLISSQERIRLNLEAAGNESQQGREYLKKLADSDSEIEILAGRISDAAKKAEEARMAYETYVSTLTVE